MASGRLNPRFGQLWQLPLLVISLALFGYSAWLFIDPQPGLTIAQKIDIARNYLKLSRPKAAIDQLNGLLEKEKLSALEEGAVHDLLAASIDQYQHDTKVKIPVYCKRIIEQTKLALDAGVAPNAETYRRLAESQEALNQTADAIASYKKLLEIDPKRSLHTQRRLIELEISTDDIPAAEAGLDHYLTYQELSPSERAWGAGESAHLLIDKGQFPKARQLLDAAAAMKVDPVDRGRLQYWIGYCAWKLGNLPEAERSLRIARDLLGSGNEMDGLAAFTLGRVAQDSGNPREAISFYETVLVYYPELPKALLARLQRGVCRIMNGADDAGLTDFHDVVGKTDQKGSTQSKFRDETLTALRDGGRILEKRSNFQGALELMGYEQELKPDPAGSFFARLGRLYESRADQLDQSLSGPSPMQGNAGLGASATSPIAIALPARLPTEKAGTADGRSVEEIAAQRLKVQQKIRQCRTLAGDAYVTYSRALTLTDDQGYGAALWKGIDLYEKADDLQRVITALEVFVNERPQDPQTPDALLRLGRSYQAAGMLDKAIASFQRNQFRYPQSLAASKSAVPLAQAYITKGPEFYSRAESALLAALENPAVTPEAMEFRQSLLELAQLYYRTGRFEEAVARLDEFTKRYPNDSQMPRILFLMADSYRKSANLIEEETARADVSATQPTASNGNPGPARTVSADQAVAAAKVMPATSPVDPVQAMAARRDRLAKAKGLYDRVVNMYRQSPPLDDVGKLYQKLSHFYRADCVYDLGNYEEAIHLYDAAAFRYQDDASSLAAYVQIVNAYCAMGRMDDARTANERAKWLLKRMPPEAFTNGAFSMPQKYWEDWLQWTTKSAAWNKPRG